MLDLEAAVAQAELILVVRLVDMTEAKIVHGGKMEVVTQQFRFEPAQTLKGIFARDALLLTGQDLGISQFAAGADTLATGQLLLLLLGRRGPGYFNCNSAETLDQSIPRLQGRDDPLIGAVRALISVTHERDRALKVRTLIPALVAAKDRDAVPLLMALRRRALLASQIHDSSTAVTRFASDPNPAVREAAARALGEMLEYDYLKNRDLREGAVKSIVGALDSGGKDLAARLAGIDALGAAGEFARSSDDARSWLSVERPATTYAEVEARLRAIGRAGRAEQRAAVRDYYDRLPFDAPTSVQETVARTLTRLDANDAASLISERLTEKSDAGLGVATEVSALGYLPRELAAPALLAAFERCASQSEQLQFALASIRVADERLVPALGALLDPRYPDVRWQATEALTKIDTDEAASVLWPQLSQETDLHRKLQLAGFLGRHGFRGGYAYAIEHMSSPELLDTAVEALAAIHEPKSIPELKKIWETSNDLSWNAAAIRALGRMGQTELTPRLLQLASDPQSHLGSAALLALADLGEEKALPLVLNMLSSRSDSHVIAAAKAARKLLDDPQIRDEAVRDRLASLLTDAAATQPVREAALETLIALDDPRQDSALGVAVRDGQIEGSELLRRIEARLAARNTKLTLP
jgi:HEAT repeat protein